MPVRKKLTYETVHKNAKYLVIGIGCVRCISLLGYVKCGSTLWGYCRIFLFFAYLIKLNVLNMGLIGGKIACSWVHGQGRLANLGTT